jgi:SAM-dependent methyltransferase
MTPAHHHNRRAWDERVRRRDSHTESACVEDFERPLAAADPLGWLGPDVRGRRILCLAAGGGKHGPLLAAAGAVVTVVDLSPAMLELDRALARARGLTLTTVEASMDDLSALGEAAFDFAVQPVSTCYVPDVRAVYREVARVCAPGGLYVSQHKQPAALQADTRPAGTGYLVREAYYRNEPLPAAAEGGQHREAGTTEYLHRWEELLGGLCRAGFVIEDVVEPRHADPAAPAGSFAHRCCFLPPFVTVKARRAAGGDSVGSERRLWMPESRRASSTGLNQEGSSTAENSK